MKVPIRYKSSDRYNAGVDVEYDDDSKLQYAPFGYATTASGDNGGDGEEGEDTMVVNMTLGPTTNSLDKTWTEISSAVNAGKTVMTVASITTGLWIGYAVLVDHIEDGYVVDVLTVDNATHDAYVMRFSADSADGELIHTEDSGPI